jgi:hypothetical protein
MVEAAEQPLSVPIHTRAGSSTTMEEIEVP